MSVLRERINFGWLPQIPDHRDIPFQAALKAALPPKIDLTEKWDFPHPYDQGMLGSCVANAIAAAIEYEQQVTHGADGVVTFLESKREFIPSRLFIYYHARELLGTINEDSGAMIRDGMKVVYNIGAPRETGWRYNPKNFTVKPPSHSYRSAPYHRITAYKAVATSAIEVKKALAEGHPVVIGISVFTSFFNREDGTIPMPGTREAMLGGHAVLVVGYNDATKRVKFLNSWGKEWGTEGYGSLPYDYVGSPYLGGDYWTLIDNEYKERMEPDEYRNQG